MKRSTLVALGLGLGLTVAGFQPGRGLDGLQLLNEAQAIYGRPATPVSAAGVARRTTRRVIYRTTIYVATLPRSCTVVVVEGTSLHLCGSTYYQPYGNQYVVVNVN